MTAYNTSLNGHDLRGTTAQRPTNAEPGQLFYDTTIDALCVANSAGTMVPIAGMEGTAAVVAAGTNQSTATALTAGVLNVVTAADAAKGVKLPATVADHVDVYNNSASSLWVYPGTSGTINSGTADAGVLIKGYSVARFFANGTTAWSAQLTLQNESRTFGASTAGAGTTTADAGVLPAATAEIYPVTGANGTVGVRINAADNIAGRSIRVANGVSTAILKIYPPSGGTINGAAADAAFSTVSGKGAFLYCSAAGVWYGW